MSAQQLADPIALAREHLTGRALTETAAPRPGRPGLVGLELELHLVDRHDPLRRPTWARVRTALDALPPMPAGSAVTVEPGGQVELSTPPCPGPVAAVRALRADEEALRSALRAALQVNRDAGPRAGWADRLRLLALLELRPVTRRTPLAAWLSGAAADPALQRRPVTTDLDYHLTTLFPPVRPRGYLELRCLDALPRRWWPALVTLTVTLADDPVAADRAREACEPLGGPPWPACPGLGGGGRCLTRHRPRARTGRRSPGRWRRRGTAATR
jgi:gamma-glutamylcysteine synthetase